MKKLNKILMWTGIAILSISCFFITINIIPPQKVMENNPFISQNGKVMNAAHRGGGALNPENTLKAFKASVNEYKVDILETDIWLTKDNKMVFNHDDTIDRMSDVNLFHQYDNIEHTIENFTLEELKNFNFGYGFETLDNQTPYKNLVTIDDENREQTIKENDLQIVEVEELFTTFYETNPNLKFIVEIKNPNEKGYLVADMLDELLQSKFPNYLNNIVVGTFNGEVERYLQEKHPNILRGASEDGATSFIVTQLLKVNLFDNSSFACLQLPLEQSGISLDELDYINRAHKKNIAVQYWTINEKEDMERLIDLKCDAIMTDNPLLLNQVMLEKYN